VSPIQILVVQIPELGEYIFLKSGSKCRIEIEILGIFGQVATGVIKRAKTVSSLKNANRRHRLDKVGNV
jgi:hypothetical protein